MNIDEHRTHDRDTPSAGNIVHLPRPSLRLDVEHCRYVADRGEIALPVSDLVAMVPGLRVETAARAIAATGTRWQGAVGDFAMQAQDMASALNMYLLGGRTDD